jgi:hypothetical protein
MDTFGHATPPASNRKASREHAKAILSELLFVFQPLVVLVIVIVHAGGNVLTVLKLTEWSFAAAVLFGQAVVKMIGIAASGARDERARLLGAITLVVGLVPSLIILSLLLADQPRPLPAKNVNVLEITQIIYFGVAVAAYAVLAIIAERAAVRTRTGNEVKANVEPHQG